MRSLPQRDLRRNNPVAVWSLLRQGLPLEPGQGFDRGRVAISAAMLPEAYFENDL